MSRERPKKNVWQKWEDQILKAVYPQGGVEGAQAALERQGSDRSGPSIQQRAFALGIKHDGKRRRWRDRLPHQDQPQGKGRHESQHPLPTTRRKREAEGSN